MTVPSPFTTTLDSYRPQVGDEVLMQLWSPQHPTWGATLAERIAAGQIYKDWQPMIVRGVMPGYDINEHRRALGMKPPRKIVTRWALQQADPAKQHGECHGYSWVEDDWAVLRLVARPAGQLDLFLEAS